MNQTMSDDIPQDQVEAVAREVLTVIRANTAIFNDVGLSLTIARAAIRAVSPLIAAVERERCATLAQKEADFQYDMAQCVGREQEQSYMIYEYGQKIASRICAAIRSVKGAVT